MIYNIYIKFIFVYCFLLGCGFKESSFSRGLEVFSRDNGVFELEESGIGLSRILFGKFREDFLREDRGKGSFRGLGGIVC